jgi:hypothetical protein
MSPLARLLNPLRTAAAAFFKHDVALRRAEGGMHIVLEQRPRKGQPKEPSRAELAARKDKQDLELMRTQLAALLDEVPETRQALRHLVFVEQAVAKKGLRSLHKLPLDVLQRGLEQLESLVTNWSPVGLASLRSKMAVAILDREHMDPEAEADAYRTAAVLDATPAPPPVLQAPQEERSDDEALAAAYAALGDFMPSTSDEVETFVELGSPSARAVSRLASRQASRPMPLDSVVPTEIRLRELQS